MWVKWHLTMAFKWIGIEIWFYSRGLTDRNILLGFKRVINFRATLKL